MTLSWAFLYWAFVNPLKEFFRISRFGKVSESIEGRLKFVTGFGCSQVLRPMEGPRRHPLGCIPHIIPAIRSDLSNTWLQICEFSALFCDDILASTVDDLRALRRSASAPE